MTILLHWHEMADFHTLQRATVVLRIQKENPHPEPSSATNFL